MLLEMKDDRAVFAERAGERQREAGKQRRRERRKNDAPENLPAARAEARGGVLKFRIEILQHRLDGPHDERQADECERDENAELRVGDLDPERHKQMADPAVRRVKRRQRDAATAVGSANGRSTSASTNFFPKKL
jgi:hypothetical protein